MKRSKKHRKDRTRGHRTPVLLRFLQGLICWRQNTDETAEKETVAPVYRKRPDKLVASKHVVETISSRQQPYTVGRGIDIPEFPGSESSQMMKIFDQGADSHMATISKSATILPTSNRTKVCPHSDPVKVDSGNRNVKLGFRAYFEQKWRIWAVDSEYPLQQRRKMPFSRRDRNRQVKKPHLKSKQVGFRAHVEPQFGRWQMWE